MNVNSSLTVAGLILSTALAGCESQPTVQEQKKNAVRIALIGRSQTDPTWPVLQVEAAAESRRPDRLWVEALAPSTPSAHVQQELLEQAAAREASVICIYPQSATSLRSTIESLVRRGVPVVVFGRAVPDCRRSAYVGPLDSDIGRAAAKACEALSVDRSNSIILFRAPLSDEEYTARFGGFMQGFAATSGLKLLRQVDCPVGRSDAPALIRDEYHKYPRVAGWALLDDWPLRSLPHGERLLPEGCGVVLASADPVYLEELRAGRISAMLGFDFRRAVRDAIFTALRLAQADTRGFVAEISIPVEVVTRENLADWDHLWRAWQQGKPPTRE